MQSKLFEIEQNDSKSRKFKQKNLSGIISRNKKIDGDYYATPPIIIEQLLIKENITGEVWEPACGEGHISKVLIEKGINVYSSDLFNRGFGEVHNFLTQKRKADIIITNPPFNIIDSFLIHAKKQSNWKVIFICSMNFLKSKKRIKNFKSDKSFPLSKIYLLDTSINYYKNGVVPKTRTGFMTSCVVVFKKNYIGPIITDWLQV